MTFDVEINGRSRSVVVEPVGIAGRDGGQFRVGIDGSSELVDGRITDLGLLLVFAPASRTVDVAVTERARGEWLMQLPHVSVTARLDGRRYLRRPASEASQTGEQRVMAPMPGRVLRVLVKPGDEVAARQGLVVVEAMKMENELGSPKAGRVKDVLVTEGVSIEAGRLLVIVE